MFYKNNADLNTVSLMYHRLIWPFYNYDSKPKFSHLKWYGLISYLKQLNYSAEMIMYHFNFFKYPYWKFQIPIPLPIEFCMCVISAFLL